MLNINNHKAFTLIELLVWIAIISIIILGSSSLNFNRLNNRQQLDIFTNKIKSNYEEIRNNSLSWKWVLSWWNLINPVKWRIQYSKSNSWTLINNYSINWTTWLNINNGPIFNNWYEISKIECQKIDWTVTTDITSWTWEIEFIWDEINLQWDCNTWSPKIIELTIKYKWEQKVITINALSWLIETN